VALARLRSRDAEVAVIDAWTAVSPPDGLDRDRLLHDPLVLAVPAAHSLADTRRDIDLSWVSSEPWICAPVGEASREAFGRLMASRDAVPKNLWVFEGLATIVALVSHGVGLAVVPRLAVPDPRPAGLVVRSIPDAPVRWIEAVTRPASRDRPATEVTLRALREATREPGL
jgi:DNA-binding transcriptional LysR family regulator